ncbi:hypothetical protein [Nocardia farcinica]|uniref:Uncharacterized protein n=1 Tax=Nocardia farcinica (strain IFM 10152) TaxID=247156 RepID=Q5YZK2_NOCFA|nr:hypothetical protein [Nocardia farcinica]BAD56389.1 hypothetical protein NFA_15440 [Nocardia farcinica IFM 10152]
MTSLNPLRYKPSQIAKALIAALTSIVGLLGLAASTFADGALATVGQWAIAAALFLAPILVFLKKAEPWIGMLDQLRGDARE